MKKLFSAFMTVMLLVTFTVNVQAVQAFELKKFLKISDEVRKETLLLEKQHVNIRDFDFFVKMMYVYLKAWDEQVKAINSRESRKNNVEEISKSYVAILSAQYISMRQYVKEYVIKKGSKDAQIANKCNRLLKLLNNGIKVLK